MSVQVLDASLTPSTTIPVRGEQLVNLRTSSVNSAAVESDVHIVPYRDGYQVIFPLYTAILDGDTLTSDLLGSDHELVMTALGYHDQTPYRLLVRVERHLVVPGQRPTLPPWRSSLLEKADFDLWEDSLHECNLRLDLLGAMPRVTGYPIQPRWPKLLK